jgi:hypothetical protein
LFRNDLIQFLLFPWTGKSKPKKTRFCCKMTVRPK